jgi:hypothetical protein
MKSRPQTLKGTKLVNVHIKMPKEVAMIFLKQPSNLGGGGSRPPGPRKPPRPPRYFVLQP